MNNNKKIALGGSGEIIKTLIFLSLLGLGVYFEGTPRYVFLVISLIYFLIIDNVSSSACLLSHTLICENLHLAPSLSYGSVIIALFIIKILAIQGKRGVKGKKILLASFLLVVVQLLTVVIFDNKLLNVIRFALNLVILAYFGDFSLDSFKRKDTIPVTVAYSVLIGSIISTGMSRTFDDLGVMRFSGIWYDQNFCGMYCVLGILSSVYAAIYDKRNLIIAIPTILLSMYMETLAMSRTFIFVIAVLALYFLYIMFRKKTIGNFTKFLVILSFAVAFIFFYDKVVAPIVEARGIVSQEMGWTNGREYYSSESLQAFLNTPSSWLTGCGITNCLHFKEQLGLHANMSHNTYVDLLVETGIPLTVIVVVFLFIYSYRSVKRIFEIDYYDLFCFTIILYMATLSMGQYALLYITLGVVLNKINNRKI